MIQVAQCSNTATVARNSCQPEGTDTVQDGNGVSDKILREGKGKILTLRCIRTDAVASPVAAENEAGRN